jgi:hypothetical protein
MGSNHGFGCEKGLASLTWLMHVDAVRPWLRSAPGCLEYALNFCTWVVALLYVLCTTVTRPTLHA